MRMLETHHQTWLQDPARFWRVSIEGDVEKMHNPQAQIVGYYLQGQNVDA